jgi:hypothetical protein
MEDLDRDSPVNANRTEQRHSERSKRQKKRP